ncbi:MAG: hypothetical protein OXQ92_01065 [Boseongicola sp.]|nr:hypothetical protein [Boseongicola sp.]MDD9976465.1 hypothetical protein [Boseongicola sp.]
MTEAQLDIRPVQDDDGLRVWSHEGQGDDLVVAFSGIGPSPKQLPGLEFASTAAGAGQNHALFIADPQRSWLNAPGLLERIVETVRAEIDARAPRRVMTLGHSMGGFMAMVLPGFVKVDAALALSPQISVDPTIVPDEMRWAKYRNGISEYRVKTALEHINPETSYVTVFGLLGPDVVQRAILNAPRNILTILMPRTHHNTAAKLRNQGSLADLTNLVLAGKIRRAKQLLAERHDATSFRGASTDLAHS